VLSTNDTTCVALVNAGTNNTVTGNLAVKFGSSANAAARVSGGLLLGAVLAVASLI